MKIESITEFTAIDITTDERDNNGYTRYSSDNWTVRLGDSDETVYDSEKLEELEATFIEFVQNNNIILSKE